MKKGFLAFTLALFALVLFSTSAQAGKTRLLTDTSSSALTVPFINAGPADDSTAATALALQVGGTEIMRVTATGSVGIGTTTPRTFVDMGSGTTGLILPTGTTGQRPSAGVAGMLRYNTTTACVEYYSGSAWGCAGSSTGTSWGTNANLFTSSGTFSPPSGVSTTSPLTIRVLVVGGGGGCSGAYGAGGSGRVAAQQLTLTSTASIAVTVGSGGAQGSAGVASSFGAYLSASGGGVGANSSGGSGGSGGGAMIKYTTASFVGCSGGSNGSDATTPTGDYYSGTNGTGQGASIVTSSTTVLGITFQSATFSAGAGGAATSPYWYSGAYYSSPGGGGGILINGAGTSGGAGTGSPSGGGGTGYGGGSGGPYALYPSYCSNAGAGVVYVEY